MVTNTTTSDSDNPSNSNNTITTGISSKPTRRTINYDDTKSVFQIDKILSTEIPKSPILFMFLSQFDMKKGNIIIWSKKSPTLNNLDLRNIEFRSLPSGIHEQTDDIVNFTLPELSTPSNVSDSKTFYHGIAYFKQNSYDLVTEDRPVDRSKVKMFSLGLVVDSTSPLMDDLIYTYQKSHHFSSANRYTTDLQSLLSQWLVLNKFDEFSIFEDYFISHTEPLRKEAILDTTINEETPQLRKRHHIEFLPFWIRLLGPLIFPLWKASLLKKRILILVPPENSFESSNSLVYCLSMLSIILKESSTDIQENTFLQPLFTVGTIDIDFLKSIPSSSGYVASTRDEVLLYKPELYDLVLKIPSISLLEDDPQIVELRTNNNELIKATRHDMEVYDKFITTQYFEDISNTEKARFSEEIESLSWLQLLIDGVFLCGTAGYWHASYHDISTLSTKKSEETPVNSNNDISDATLVERTIRYFQQRNSFLYNQLKEIIETESTISITTEPIIISASTLAKLDLDLFSQQDHEFIEILAYKWFNKEVEISLASDCMESIC